MSSEILIIGSGPAGLSAAVQARARGRQAVVISNPAEENPLWKSEKVNNYLGLPGVTGAELLDTFRRHAESAGAEFVQGRVLNAAYTAGTWYLSIGSDVREAGAIVLAGGVVRSRKFPGEEAFLGRGVSYCATCDGMLYRGKRVAVLGWTPSAAHEADFLREIGCDVTYFEKPRQCAITGDAAVTGVTCDGTEAAADGIFILRPTVAPTDLFPGLAVENGYVQTDRRMATNLPGLFAAGDCTGGPLQVAKAVGEGLVAGQSAAAYLDGLERQKKESGKEKEHGTETSENG